MSAEQNIEARKAAEFAFTLTAQALNEQTSDTYALTKAWIALTEMIDQTMQKERREAHAAPGAMSDEAAARFERSSMPFGKYQGQPIKDVPLDYLAWVDEDAFRWISHVCRTIFSVGVHAWRLWRDEGTSSKKPSKTTLPNGSLPSTARPSSSGFPSRQEQNDDE